MTQWSPADARAIATPEEIQLTTRRQDDTLRKPRTIWIVSDGDRVFVRSTNGRTADWFRAALTTGNGQIIAGGTTYDVAFGETEDGDLARVDAGLPRQVRPVRLDRRPPRTGRAQSRHPRRASRLTPRVHSWPGDGAPEDDAREAVIAAYRAQLCAMTSSDTGALDELLADDLALTHLTG